MNETQNEFEDELRQLKPVMPDGLAEETFYQAGWKAAEAALSRQQKTASSPSGSHRATGTFVSGLLCGLAVSIVNLTAWLQPAAETPEAIVQQVDSQAAEEPSNPEASVPDPVEPFTPAVPNNDYVLTSANLLPWAWPAMQPVNQPVSQESQPLSLAAQRNGSGIVLARPSTILRTASNAAVSPVPADREQLRSLPVTEAMVEELL